MIVVDASVLVAAHRPSEQYHASSSLFLESVERRGVGLRCPSLALVECASAVVRGTNDARLARSIIELVLCFPRLAVEHLSPEQWMAAVDAAIRCGTKGADSVYIALAEHHHADLITWDNEMLLRGATLVRTATPDQWLRAQSEREDR